MVRRNRLGNEARSIGNVVQHQGSGCDQGPAVFEHGLDLGNQRVIHLKGLDRPEGGLGQQGAGGGNRVDDIGLVRAACPPMGRSSLSRNFAVVEPASHDCDGDMGAPPSSLRHLRSRISSDHSVVVQRLLTRPNPT